VIFEPEYFTEKPKHVVVHDSAILEKNTNPNRIIEGAPLILGRKLDYAILGGLVLLVGIAIFVVPVQGERHRHSRNDVCGLAAHIWGESFRRFRQTAAFKQIIRDAGAFCLLAGTPLPVTLPACWQ
jgi:hypothetical protein